MMDEDLLHASIWLSTPCWVFERDRRLRCLLDEIEVVWPPAAEGVEADAFREAERRGRQVIDNTCTVYDLVSRDRARVPGGDWADCGAHRPYVTRDGCLVAVGIEESRRTQYRGIVCGAPDRVTDIAVSVGYAAVLHRGSTAGNLDLLRSNLFDPLLGDTARNLSVEYW